MAAKYNASDYVFQFITVTAGVLIALLINAAVEWRDHRGLVNEARDTIRRELAGNKKDLDLTLGSFPRDRAAMDSAIQFSDDILKKGKTDITSLELHYNLADNLLDAGWRTAERTGALSYMDYAEVQRYSKVYDFQELFLENQRTALAQLTAASSLIAPGFDPDHANKNDVALFRDRVMLLRGTVGIMEKFAARLSELYDEALQPAR